MEMTDDASRIPQMVHATNDFELHDFTDEANFNQFVDLIRGENDDLFNGFDCDLINGLMMDNQFGNNPTQEDVFNFSATDTSSAMVPSQNFDPIIKLPSFGEDMEDIEGTNDHGEDMQDIEGINDHGEEDSSGTITTTTKTTTRKAKTDRSRTLISERKRRGRMKEKLYALRSLVPNITKMDNASIIGDAVLYVQGLQMQAKKLKTEIAGLEATLAGPEIYQGSTKNLRKIQIANNINAVCKKIMQMDMFQVEERAFYVRLVCNKGYGIVASLYKALESLTSFNIQSANLTTVSEGLVLTFTLNVKEGEMDMNLPNLKLWVTGAFFNQGFEFLTSSCF